MRLESDAILDKAARLKAEGKPFALVTVVRVVSPTSAKPGAKAVVEPDGVIQGWIGGGCAQPAVIKTAKKVLQEGLARLIRISPTRDGYVEEGITDFGMTCHSGGTLDIFIDPVIPRPVLLVIGASPAAQALVGLAQRVGFSVTAAFTGADAEMFPDADRIIDGFDVADVSPSFVVVATQGKRDEQGLEAAISIGAVYIAFIASERKATKLKTYLKENGCDADRVDAIISPAGVEIEAVTPEEIALSVLAGVVKARREGVAVPQPAVASSEIGSSYSDSTKAEVKPEPKPATAIDPICGMSVETKDAEYQSEYKGKTYYFCCGGCEHRFENEPEKYLRA
ncbi:MAG: XdhC family protein [Acidiferrobacterales bacterium]